MLRKLSGLLVLVLTLPAAAQDMPLAQILIEGEGWKSAARGFQDIRALATAADGRLIIADRGSKKILALNPDGKPEVLGEAPGPLSGLAWKGSQGYLTDSDSRQLWSLEPPKHAKLGAPADIALANLTVTADGTIYAVAPLKGAVYRWRPSEEAPRAIVTNLTTPSGIVLWPDQGTLVVSEAVGRKLWTYRVETDGSLGAPEGYYTLRLPFGSKESGGSGMCVDSAGRLYAASAAGVQVFDPTGRLSGVLLKPKSGDPVAVALAGKDHDLLYVAWADEIFVRRVKAKGGAK